jgi:hypothetical protein
VLSDKFSLLWSKETEGKNEHIGYTQIFNPDEKQILYASQDALNALDYLTGDLLWSIKIPEDAFFHFYNGNLYVLAAYDKTIPFAPEEELVMPSHCNSEDLSTMRVYNPKNGEIIWEYSYHMVSPYELSFTGNSAFIEGLTIAPLAKYLSEFEIDSKTGKIIQAACQNYNDSSRLLEGDTEGVLSSGTNPIMREWQWKLNTDEPAFTVEGTKITLMDRKTRQPTEVIEFSGSELNPYDVQVIIHNDLFAVLLEDSRQFFVFQMK